MTESTPIAQEHLNQENVLHTETPPHESSTDHDAETHENQHRQTKISHLFPEFLQERVKVVDETISKIEKEAKDQLRKLTGLGEHAQEDGRKFWNNVVERTRVSRNDVEKWMESSIERVISKLQLPTRKDLEATNRKINQLSKKIDELKRMQSKTNVHSDEPEKMNRPKKSEKSPVV